MTTAVVVRRGGVGDALVAAGVLAVSAVLTVLIPVLGAVRAADGSPTWFAPGALWVMLLPAVATAALAVRRPVLALAVAAGAGIIAAARLLDDLPVVLSPDSLARPDLFVETTDRSLPFHAAAGGYLLLVADAIAVAGGVLAALRLSGRLSFQRRSDLDPAASHHGDPTASDDDARAVDPVTATGGPGSVGAASRADNAGGADDIGVPGARRNYLMAAAGFVGVLLLAVGALAVPYRGGYLDGRYVAVGVPLAGLVGVLLLVVLAATAVLIAASLPRSLAVALLGGVALGAFLPFLAALVAVVTAPVSLSPMIWFGLAGAVVLAAGGLLARVVMVRTADAAGEATDDVAAPSPVVALLAGVAAIGAGGLAAAAAVLPALAAGGLEDLLVLSDGSPVPGPTLFAAAAVPLVVAGALAVVPATARAGRAALMVVWAAAVPAVTMALDVLGDDGLATARLMDLVSIGSGTWCGVAALALACVAAVLAAVTSHRAAEESQSVPDDDSVAAARTVTAPLAGGLAVLAVVAALLPVYGTSGQTQGPAILRGYAVQAWGVWALLLVTIGALVAAAVTRHRWVALTLGLAAAAVQATRLVVPEGVRQTAGFGLRPGVAVQGVLVLALIGGAIVLADRAGRITELDAAGYDSAFVGAASAGAGGRASSDGGARTPSRRRAGTPAGRRAATRTAGRTTPRSRRKHR